MNDQLRKKLSDSPVARWTALFIVAFTMMMGYYITYQMSPLESLLESSAQGGMNWTSTEYGFFSGSYGFINVFLLMLFFGGLILDKKGVRFTGLLACSLMVIGVMIMYYAVTFVSAEEATHVNLPLLGLPDMMLKRQVIISALGFSIFGVGNEMCGITVSKVMVKWFTGHEMALAMGIQVGLARLGTGAAMSVSLPLALRHSLSAPLLLSLVLICAALLFYIVYCVMDRRLEKSAPAVTTSGKEDDESFRFSDIFVTVKSPGFWLITILCLLFYSAMNPFFNFAPKLMMVKYGISADVAGLIPAIIPFGSIVLTPLFGTIYDRRGYGATLIIIGTLLMGVVHFVFSLPLHSSLLAVSMMIILGLAFSLVPSALWPSVPKIIPLRRLGTAYGMIFFIQNIGLMVVRMLIGRVNETDPSYTSSMTIFALFGGSAFVSALLLYMVDKRKKYGLQKPNIQE